MPDQIITAVAVALATKTAEAAFGGARDAFTALASLVRERFSHDESARKALSSAENAPHDPAAVRALAEALDQLASADPEFAAHIRHLRRQVAAEGNVNLIGTANGSTVQAGVINGDIHFGKP